MKRCTQCGETKPAEAFYRRKAECKHCSIERAQRWNAANPERVKATRVRNAESRKAANRRQWQERKNDPAVREAARERARKWRETNRERHRAYSTQWQQDNREQYRRNMRDSMRRRRVGRDDLAAEYADVLRGDPCSYCEAPCEHIDHIVPVAKGGPNDWSNLTAACTACNSQKRTISMLEFMRRNGTSRTTNPD